MSSNGEHSNPPAVFPFGEELQALVAAALAAGRPLPEIIFTLVITTHDLENRFIRSVNAKPVPPEIVIHDGGRS